MKFFEHTLMARKTGLFTGVVLALFANDVFAQAPAAPAPPAATPPAATPPAATPPAATEPAATPPAATEPAAPAEVAPTTAPAEPAAAEAPPAPTGPALESMPPAVAPEPMVAPVEPAATSAEDEAKGGLSWNLFVDGSYHYTTTRSGAQVAAHQAWETNHLVSVQNDDGSTSLARVADNGFALHWVGLDAAYDAGAFGASASLRFGQAVPVYLAGNATDLGIENLTQAYVTWKPMDKLKLDFGQFATIYGAEVAESWRNLNYSRGGLYYGLQPAWHTGLRGNYAINDQVSINALVVNGVNTIVDNNDKPSLGLQVAIAPSDSFSLAVGYLGALEPNTDDPDAFSHLFDLVASVSVGDLKLILNGDYSILNPDHVADNVSFFGLSAAVGYTINEHFGLAGRYEFLSDADNALYQVAGASDVSVNTLTATIDVKPVTGAQNLIIRWDNRYEFSSEDIYIDKDSIGANNSFSSILGVVVNTGG